MGKRKKTLWAETVGTKPNSVRVFERTKGGPLSIRYWDPSKAGFTWEALGHRDRKKARAEALETAAKLERGEQLMEDGKTILAQLFLAYERHRTPRKSKREQKADARRIEMFTRVWGAEQAVYALTEDQWERFVDERRSGAICAHGSHGPHQRADKSECPGPRGREVGDRTIEADLKWLRLVIGWGTRRVVGHDSRGAAITLLTSDPTRRFEIPKEQNPSQPVASTDRYEAIRAVSDQVGELSDFLDVMVGTGRRLSAVRLLRFEDLDLSSSPAAPHGSIRWRAENDKMGREAVVPMGPGVRVAIDRIRQKRPGIGAAWLFPSPKDPEKPMSRYVPDRWLRRAEKLAELEPQQGTLWHAYRRAWATARKHLPAPDVAEAGGWKRGSQVLTKIYQQADEATTLKVVLEGAEIREVKA